MDIAKKLKELREKTGKSQRQVADELGFTDAFISKLETGKSDPSLKTLKKLAEYYDTELAYLLTEKHEWYKILPKKLKDFVREENIGYLEIISEAYQNDIPPEVVESIIKSIKEVKKTQK